MRPDEPDIHHRRSILIGQMALRGPKRKFNNDQLFCSIIPIAEIRVSDRYDQTLIIPAGLWKR